MRLSRMGSFHATRLSFTRTLLRRLATEGWRFRRTMWEIDATGTGQAIYTVTNGVRTYALVCFARDLPEDQRSDRVIATAWDATFALFDGEPTPEDVERLSRNVPYQEAGRVSDKELTLSRANRSVRMFDHVVGRLAEGKQPDADEVDKVGYLMRTTAVYGSGKFGAADRAKIAGRPELRGPFQAEMLTVWLIRAFTLDLVEHLAHVRGGERAAVIEPALRRRFGVGNSTGLGMAPFLMNHPVLINNWMLAREEALARVRSRPQASEKDIAAFAAALEHARENARTWVSEHPVQIGKLSDLRRDLELLSAHLPGPMNGAHPWDALWHWGKKTLSLEGQEALVSLLLEPHGELIDGLADCMDADEDAAFAIDGRMTCSALGEILRDRYGWALDVDYDRSENCARFWYVSEEKLEPRLGERHEEDGARLEQPLGIGRDAARLAGDLEGWTGEDSVGAFLLEHPEHRHMVRRAQITSTHPFAEVRDNLISADLLPIDLLRCKLSFFGATHFDPRSDRWVRISLFPGAPFPHEMLEAAE